jgi:MSHA biogenesis protein MshG
MPAFAYRGRDARGGLVAGRLEGADSSAVADQLLAIGVTPVENHPGRRGAIRQWKPPSGGGG